MQKTWVLVADTTRARFFSVDKPLGPLTEVHTLVHTESRLHEQELTSDARPGRNVGASGGHSMGHESDPKRQENIRFAREISGYLDGAHSERRFDRLYIVAAPSFLGELRQTLGKGVVQTVAEEVSKNITRLEPHDIRQHLPERL
jgi:protein required for attachment to host cells